jgi:hypothetical protein
MASSIYTPARAFVFLFGAVCLFLPFNQKYLEAKNIRPVPKIQVTSLELSDEIKLDGRLLEPIWKRALPLGDLTMVEPDEGIPPTEKTEIRLAATSSAWYIGVMCYDSDPRHIVSHTMQRDAELRGEDHIKLVFDTFLNGRTGYIFAVNPNGARYDALITQEGERENKEWDGIWEAATHRSEEGWSVEIYIPIKTLRFQTGLSRWGFNAERRIQRLLERDRWANPNLNFKVTHVSQAGQITDVPVFEQGLGLTVRPYVRGDRIRDGYEAPYENTGTAGLDVMKNFGGNVTGLLSVNTDFAETEVDTRRVNLTRFPLFYPEKRTFFLEGSDIYEFGLGMGFHRTMDLIPFFSRRIGLVEGEVVPLDASVKATGGFGRFNFGVLDVLTRPVGDLAPRTNLLAARGYQNIWQESKLGFIVTSGDPLGRKGSYQVGADFVYKTSQFQGDKNFLVGVWGLVTDREDLGRDRTAVGFSVDLPNDLWDISFSGKRIGEDFDPSLGFVPWRGIYKVRFDVAYKPRPELSWLRQMWYEWFSSAAWDVHGKIYHWGIFTAPINWHLESGDRIEFNIYPNYERIPERFYLTDEIYIDPGEYNFTRWRLELQTASKRRVFAKVSWWFGTWYDGHIDQIQLTANWRPTHHLNLALEGERNLVRVSSGDADIQLARARMDLFITPSFQILNYLQYDNQTESLGLNCRLRWTYRSLLDVFLVYNRNWFDMENRWLSDLNQFLIKVQYSWRH